MKAIIELPCCGEHIEVEHADPDALAVKLTIEMNKHYVQAPFRCSTMEEWWTVCAEADIGLVVEDGESLHEEYARVMGDLTVGDRQEVMAIYGFLIGMDTVMAGQVATHPMLPVPDVEPFEGLSFHIGLQAGGQYALVQNMEAKFPASRALRPMSELVIGWDDDDEGVVAPPTNLRAFDELTSVPPGMLIH